MKRGGILIAAMAMLFMVMPIFSVSAEDGADHEVVCTPNPYPSDDCMPAFGTPIHIEGTNIICDLPIDEPYRVSTVVYDLAEVDCGDGRMHNGELTNKIFWTTCDRQDGDKCPLESNDYPHNPAKDTCTYCGGLTARPAMNGRIHYCRYYWAHTIARASNFATASVWTGPTRICIP